jgi:hypothetical protein
MGEYMGNWRADLKMDVKNIIVGIGLMAGVIPQRIIYNSAVDADILFKEKIYGRFNFIIGYRLPLIDKYWN